MRSVVLLSALLQHSCSALHAQLLPMPQQRRAPRCAVVRLLFFSEDVDKEEEKREREAEAAATAAKRPVPVLDTGRGPFASTLGVLNPPDEEVDEEDILTQEKPLFQQRMDWHFAAHFNDAEQQQALGIEEDARRRTLEAAAPRNDEEEVYEDPTYQYMVIDEREAAALKSGSASSKVPSSWQEFQAMRDELARLEQVGSKKQREKAVDLSERLETFYNIFKSVLAEGWGLDYDPLIEEIGTFLAKATKQAESDLTIDVIGASGDAGGIEAGMSRMHPGGSG